MSDASVQRVVIRRSPVAETRPLSRGLGLLIGAGASFGLWGVIFWLLARALG